MEARLKRVGDDVRAVRGDITALLVRQGAVEARLGILEGKVEGLARQIGDLGVMLRTKIMGPWQTLGIVPALLTAAMTLPLGIPRVLALIP